MSRIIINVVSSRELPYYGEMNVQVMTDEGSSSAWLPSFRHKRLLLEALTDGLKTYLTETPEGDDIAAVKETLEELEFVRALDMQF
jgi:hypothetical protein